MSFNSSPNYGTRTVISTSILKRLDDLEKTKDLALREDIDELKEKTRSLENSINAESERIDVVNTDIVNISEDLKEVNAVVIEQNTKINNQDKSINEIRELVQNISHDDFTSELKSSYSFYHNRNTYNICYAHNINTDEYKLIMWFQFTSSVKLFASFNENGWTGFSVEEGEYEYANINKSLAIVLARLYIIQSYPEENLNYCKDIQHTLVKNDFATGNYSINLDYGYEFLYKDEHYYVGVLKDNDVSNFIVYRLKKEGVSSTKIWKFVKEQNKDLKFIEHQWYGGVDYFAECSPNLGRIIETLFINSGVE